MDAAFMSLELHERGIHALWLGTGGSGVTKIRFSADAASTG
jgi:hypothetical protein